MRIATWNLARPRPSSERRPALLDRIERIDADIWVLTETLIELSPGSDYFRAAYSSCSGDRATDECWVAIWARRDTRAEPIPVSDTKRAACCKLFRAGGGEFIVYGTVLPWLGDKSQLPLKGADAFLSALSVQQEDWRRIRASGPTTPLCVAGDFNQDLLPAGHYYGSNRGRAALRSVLRDHGLICLTGESLDPIASKYAHRACIDHICLAGLPGLADQSGAPLFRATVWPCEGLLGPKLSDHFGVAIDLP